MSREFSPNSLAEKLHSQEKHFLYLDFKNTFIKINKYLYLNTDTGGWVHYIKEIEITLPKELGKITS